MSLGSSLSISRVISMARAKSPRRAIRSHSAWRKATSLGNRLRYSRIRAAALSLISRSRSSWFRAAASAASSARTRTWARRQVRVVGRLLVQLAKQCLGPVELLLVPVDLDEHPSERPLGKLLGLGFDQRRGGSEVATGFHRDILRLHQFGRVRRSLETLVENLRERASRAVGLGGVSFSTAASIR